MNEPRIVSLLASATELVVALGLGERLVGRSHECDHPAWVKRLPALSRPTFDITGTSLEIDQRVREKVAAGKPLYEIDEEALAALAPDFVLTQTHCEVCAVSPQNLCRLERRQVVALTSGTIAGILEGFARVAAVLGAAPAGEALLARLRPQLAQTAAATAGLPRPRVACLEWIDPIFAMGNWGPEIVEAAGGECLLGVAGAHSAALPFDALVAADPDVIVIAPCGFDSGADAGGAARAHPSRRLARTAGRARRARLRRRRQPVLQPVQPDAVRDPGAARRDAAPGPIRARTSRLGLGAHPACRADTEFTIRPW